MSENVKEYYLHRISHETDLSYALYDKGYLSIGFKNARDIGLAKVEDTDENYNELKEKYKVIYPELGRKYNGLWRFCHMKKGDIVVVPLSGGKFSVCEVLGSPISVSECDLGYIKSKENKEFILDEGVFKNEVGDVYDIGYLVPIKGIKGKEKISRKDFAPARLISRMKIRQTNAKICDIRECVDRVISSDGKINFNKEINAKLVPELRKWMEYIDPNKFEELIKWYFEKLGASYVIIPSKNEPGKEDGADADVIATFNLLKTIFYVQAKRHCEDSQTNEWAVEQISKYKEQKAKIRAAKDEDYDNYTCIAWVISSAYEFNDEAEKMADESGVILINGTEFAEMLLQVGFKDIDEAFK